MKLIQPVVKINKSNLFFSKNELTKILNCYSIGVAKGNWKDYAISFGINNVDFYIFKNSLASADCVVSKIKKNKKIPTSFNLEFRNRKKLKFFKIDDLLITLNRNQLKII